MIKINECRTIFSKKNEKKRTTLEEKRKIRKKVSKKKFIQMTQIELFISITLSVD